MLWLIVGTAVILLLAVYLLFTAKFVRIIKPIFETSPTLIPADAGQDEEAELVEIPVSNGLMLSACLYTREETESRGLIVFCPEFGANKWSWRNYALALWQAGYDILSFDFRNQGESDSIGSYKQLHWVSEHEINDVHAVISYIRSRPDLRERSIGLMGVSRGGTAALAAGSESPHVELICADSAFPTEPMMLFYLERWVSLYASVKMHQLMPQWHTRLLVKIAKWMSQLTNGCIYAEVLPRLKRMSRRKRTFLIAGTRDSFVPPELTYTLRNSLGETCEELWMVKGAKHNQARKVDPQGYQDRLVSFFSSMSPVHEFPVEQTVEQATV